GASLGLIETQFHLGDPDAAVGGQHRHGLPRDSQEAARHLPVVEDAKAAQHGFRALPVEIDVDGPGRAMPVGHGFHQHARSDCCPMASTTVSHGITFSSSLKAGLKRPFSSKTEPQARTLRPVTTPSLPTISFGPHPLSTAMPSCSASWTSLCQAGICWRDSRLTRYTCSAPERNAMRAASKAGWRLSAPDSSAPDSHDSCTNRTAARATSMATLPPPTTTTRFPS